MDNKKSGKDSATGIDRQSMLKMGVAGAAGSMLLPGAAMAADEKKPVGNYPKGVEGDSVFIGLTLDITGPYSAQGADQQKGYELAVGQLNRSEERRRGKECVSTCRSRGSPDPEKKK